jgi:hypothetical protein
VHDFALPAPSRFTGFLGHRCHFGTCTAVALFSSRHIITVLKHYEQYKSGGTNATIKNVQHKIIQLKTNPIKTDVKNF